MTGPERRAPDPVVTRTRTATKGKPPLPMTQRWAVTVPGTHAHVIATDLASGSVIVGDGWAVALAALRLHRLDAATGAATASVRTRHQSVGGLRVHDSHLWAATDSRLFRLRLEELEVVQDWERGLVRYASQIEVADERVVLANWLSPSVAILDTASGRLRRVRVREPARALPARRPRTSDLGTGRRHANPGPCSCLPR